MGVTDDIARSYLLTEIIITLKSFGDSFQVYYSKKLRDYLRNNIDLYISSTDKNVGGECLLINNTFWLIGTGIRPHSDFFTNYLGFFGRESFKQKAMGLGVIEGETEIDGTVAITTNKSLMNEEKYIESINNTFSKINPYLTNTPVNPISDEHPIYTPDDIIEHIIQKRRVIPPPPSEPLPENLNINTFTGITPVIKLLLDTENTMLNEKGKYEIIRITYEILRSPTQEEKISKLKELDAFLKKIYEVINLTEPEPEPPMATATAAPPSGSDATTLQATPVPITPSARCPDVEAVEAVPVDEIGHLIDNSKKSLLFKKLDTLTSFLKMKFTLSLKAITKNSIIKDQGKLKDIIQQASAQAKFDNIIPQSLINFSQAYLDGKYTDMIQTVETEYTSMMKTTNTEIQTTIETLAVIADAAAPTRESFGRSTKKTEEQKLQDKINEEILEQKLKGNSSAGQGKLAKLKESCDSAKSKLDDLIRSFGDRKLKAAENKKIASAMKLVETSLRKYEEKKQAVEAAEAAAIEEKAKAKLNTDKRDPVKVTTMITGMLSDMSCQLGRMSSSFFGSRPRGGKRKYTRKNNRKLKKKSTRRMLLKASKITKKNNNRIKKKRTRRVKHKNYN